MAVKRWPVRLMMRPDRSSARREAGAAGVAAAGGRSARQPDVERAAGARTGRFNPDLPAVRLDDHLADVEPQADPLGGPAEARVDAVEPLEDAAVLLARD